MSWFFRRLKLSLVMLPLLLLAAPGIASAHVLKQDNGISAVLHIPPEDNPEAGQVTDFDLSFGDASNAFSLPDCRCQVTVKNSNGKTLYQTVPKPAQQGDTLDSVVHFNFPTIGVYNLTVSGSAIHGNFKTFQLDYLIRVATSVNGPALATGSGQGSEVLIISVGSLAILAMFAYTGMRAGGRYVTQSASKRATLKPDKRATKSSKRRSK
jgi:hypothetical protein